MAKAGLALYLFWGQHEKNSHNSPSFLGSCFTEKPLKESSDVMMVDNYFTGAKETNAYFRKFVISV